MKERVNPETGKPECTITKADQEVISKVRNLLRRIFLGCPAEIVYEVQGVTIANDHGEFADQAERADECLDLIGWPTEPSKKPEE